MQTRVKWKISFSPILKSIFVQRVEEIIIKPVKLQIKIEQ